MNNLNSLYNEMREVAYHEPGQWGLTHKVYATSQFLVVVEVEPNRNLTSGAGKVTSYNNLKNSGDPLFYGREAYRFQVKLSPFENHPMIIDNHISNGLSREIMEGHITSQIKREHSISKGRRAHIEIFTIVLPFITTCALTKFCLRYNLSPLTL